jgi:hypothetical protein
MGHLSRQFTLAREHQLSQQAELQRHADESMKQLMARVRADSLAKGLYKYRRPDQKMQYTPGGAPVLTWH